MRGKFQTCRNPRLTLNDWRQTKVVGFWVPGAPFISLGSTSVFFSLSINLLQREGCHHYSHRYPQTREKRLRLRSKSAAELCSWSDSDFLSFFWFRVFGCQCCSLETEIPGSVVEARCPLDRHQLISQVMTEEFSPSNHNWSSSLFQPILWLPDLRCECAPQLKGRPGRSNHLNCRLFKMYLSLKWFYVWGSPRSLFQTNVEIFPPPPFIISMESSLVSDR